MDQLLSYCLCIRKLLLVEVSKQLLHFKRKHIEKKENSRILDELQMKNVKFIFFNIQIT